MKKKRAGKKRQTKRLANRQYKNNLFIYLFTRKKEYALSLYNAVNNTEYQKKRIKIPVPKYIVFYNGPVSDMKTDKEEQHLSDAFQVRDKTGGFEWTATILNINPGYNEELFSKCDILWEYTLFVEKVKRKSKCKEPDAAMREAVRESLTEGILKDFFKEYGEEIMSMEWYEVDQEMIAEIQFREALEDARVEGMALGIEEGRAAGREEGRAEAERKIFLLRQEKDNEILLLQQENKELREMIAALQ